MISSVSGTPVGLALLLITTVSLLEAQAPSPSATADLAAPTLQVHATVGQNNLPGINLMNALVNAHSVAVSHGIASNDVTITVGEEPNLPSNFDFNTLYKAKACKADAIVVGHATALASHTSARGEGIYSDYSLAVDRVLKDGAPSPIAASPAIVVTRPGGSLTLSTGGISGNVEFVNRFFPSLRMNAPYLLFMAYIPQSGGYVALDSYSSFTLNANRWQYDRQSLVTVTSPALVSGVFESSIVSWLATCSK